MSNENRPMLRSAVRGGYDLQALRIETGNRLIANFRQKLGMNEDEGPREDGEESFGAELDILAELKKHYRRITDGVAEVTRRRTYDYTGVISDYTELYLVGHYLDLCTKEGRLFREIGKQLDGIPIWEEFLKDIKGIGPAMAGVIVSEMDPHKAEYPSSFWRYAGLDVADDGKGRSKRSEHLIEVEYTDSDGNDATRKGITFNPFLKTKLVGVLATSFLRSGNEQYREIYDNYKNRISSDERHEDKSKGHIHRMSLRYMIKMFLIDLHVKWRSLEGLKVSKPYAQKKLGHKDHGRADRLGVEYDD